MHAVALLVAIQMYKRSMRHNDAKMGKTLCQYLMLLVHTTSSSKNNNIGISIASYLQVRWMLVD